MQPPPLAQPAVVEREATPSHEHPVSGGEEATVEPEGALEAPNVFINADITSMNTNEPRARSPVRRFMRQPRSVESLLGRRDIPLTREQENLIDIAESSLTRPQRDLIAKRHERIRENREAIRRGKQVDPREWGNLGIPANELDLEAQQRELAQFEERAPNMADPESDSRAQDSRETNVHKKKSSKSKKKVAVRERQHSATAPLSNEMDTLIAETTKKSKARKSKNKKKSKGKKPKDIDMLLPSNQVAKDSYLGRALSVKPKGRSSKNGHNPSDSSSSESSSDDSSSDESTSDSDEPSNDSSSEDNSSDSPSEDSSSSDESDSSDSEPKVC